MPHLSATLPARWAAALAALLLAFAGCSRPPTPSGSPTATPTPIEAGPECGGGDAHDVLEGPFPGGVDVAYGGALLPDGVTHAYLWSWVKADEPFTLFVQHDRLAEDWSTGSGGNGTPAHPFWVAAGALPAGNLTWGVTFGIQPEGPVEVGTRFVYQVGGTDFACLPAAMRTPPPAPLP